MHISVIIPTLNRKDSLNELNNSLNNQSFTDFEKVYVTEEGELAQIRNLGFQRAKGDIVIFIDDDVVLPKHYLRHIHDILLKRDDIAGVSGPALIPKSLRGNRDITRFKFVKAIYDVIFLEGKKYLPGIITNAGTPTMAMDETMYEGEVDFLEACNMAFRRKDFESVGGFDETYRGVGDWSEPDICYRIRLKGRKLWFSSSCGLTHKPSRSGAFKKRDSDNFRLENYKRFLNKWVPSNYKKTLNLLFTKTYYKLKSAGVI